MSLLGSAARLSLASVLGVLGYGAVEKVRIDARASLAEADSRLVRSRATGAPEDYVLAAESCANVLDSWSPFDDVPVVAVDRLLDLLPRMPPRPALRIVDQAIASIDSLALFFTPLAAERERLLAGRATIAQASPDRLADEPPAGLAAESSTTLATAPAAETAPEVEPVHE